MCKRFSFVCQDLQIEAQFGLKPVKPLITSYNIAPTDKAYVITNEQPKCLQYLTWGLVPTSSKDGKNVGKLINARANDIFVSPSFRMPVRNQRCIVLADSFYVWQQRGTQKIPYRILSDNKPILALAGIWEIWRAQGIIIKSFSIITEPTEDQRVVWYAQKPKILSEEEQEIWLDTTSLNELKDILQKPSMIDLSHYRISDKINLTTYNAMDLHDEEITVPIIKS